jgi:hypothetical protein
MSLTGPAVIWVVGARFPAGADAGPDSPIAQFKRDTGAERVLQMSPGRFDPMEIFSYLQSRPGMPPGIEFYVGEIARFTQGLPLAVSLTAGLLEQGHPVSEVCGVPWSPNPGEVVSALARSYLPRAEAEAMPTGDRRPADVGKILGLALAYGDLRTDPALLAALWDVNDPLAAFEDLARRYDFVLPGTRRLQDEVRDTLRADLLDAYRRNSVRHMNRRAADLFVARLAEIRSRWPVLDDQLAHDAASTAVLSLLWHTLWIDNQDGLDLLMNLLPVLAVTAPATGDAAAAMSGHFVPVLDAAQKRDLDEITQIWPSGAFAVAMVGSDGFVYDPKRQVRVTPAGLSLLGQRTPREPLLGTAADRQAAVLLLKAQLEITERRESEALPALRAAAALTSSGRLRRTIWIYAGLIVRRPASAGQSTKAAAADAAQLADEMISAGIADPA